MEEWKQGFKELMLGGLLICQLEKCYFSAGPSISFFFIKYDSRLRLRLGVTIVNLNALVEI